jgi:hypothetical protein
VGKSYSSAREAIFLNGTFIVDYLKVLDASGSDNHGLAESPVACALLDEVCCAALPIGCITSVYRVCLPSYMLLA